MKNLIYYVGNAGKIINHNLKGHFFINKGEIFTEKELVARKICKAGFTIIETPKNNTYKLFGERYIIDNEKVRKIK